MHDRDSITEDLPRLSLLSLAGNTKRKSDSKFRRVPAAFRLIQALYDRGP
jgi:hypothetical protein